MEKLILGTFTEKKLADVINYLIEKNDGNDDLFLKYAEFKEHTENKIKEFDNVIAAYNNEINQIKSINNNQDARINEIISELQQYITLNTEQTIEVKKIFKKLFVPKPIENEQAANAEFVITNINKISDSKISNAIENLENRIPDIVNESAYLKDETYSKTQVDNAIENLENNISSNFAHLERDNTFTRSNLFQLSSGGAFKLLGSNQKIIFDANVNDIKVDVPIVYQTSQIKENVADNELISKKIVDELINDTFENIEIPEIDISNLATKEELELKADKSSVYTKDETYSKTQVDDIVDNLINNGSGTNPDGNHMIISDATPSPYDQSYPHGALWIKKSIYKPDNNNNNNFPDYPAIFIKSPLGWWDIYDNSLITFLNQIDPAQADNIVDNLINNGSGTNPDNPSNNRLIVSDDAPSPYDQLYPQGTLWIKKGINKIDNNNFSDYPAIFIKSPLGWWDLYDNSLIEFKTQVFSTTITVGMSRNGISTNYNAIGAANFKLIVKNGNEPSDVEFLTSVVKTDALDESDIGIVTFNIDGVDYDAEFTLPLGSYSEAYSKGRIFNTTNNHGWLSSTTDANETYTLTLNFKKGAPANIIGIQMANGSTNTSAAYFYSADVKLIRSGQTILDKQFTFTATGLSTFTAKN